MFCLTQCSRDQMLENLPNLTNNYLIPQQSEVSSGSDDHSPSKCLGAIVIVGPQCQVGGAGKGFKN